MKSRGGGRTKHHKRIKGGGGGNALFRRYVNKEWKLLYCTVLYLSPMYVFVYHYHNLLSERVPLNLYIGTYSKYIIHT